MMFIPFTIPLLSVSYPFGIPTFFYPFSIRLLSVCYPFPILLRSFSYPLAVLFKFSALFFCNNRFKKYSQTKFEMFKMRNQFRIKGTFILRQYLC